MRSAGSEPRGAAAFPLPAVSAADHCADDRQIGTGNQRKDLPDYA